MHALVAAAGSAASRLERFREGAARTGARFVECTPEGAAVRLGVAAAGGSVLEWAEAGGRAAALLGSGVLAFESGASSRMLHRHRERDTGWLDGAPDHIAAVVVDVEATSLSFGSTPGNHRLFVAELDGGVLVSTSVCLLTWALGPDLQVDRSYEDFLLGFGFLPDGRTPYKGVHVHPSGTVRRWPDGNVTAVEPPVHDAPDPPDDRGRVRRALRDTFFAALEEQAGGRRRHAVLLGGFDSALVVAGLRRLGHEVDTYTFAFGDPRYEQRNAELVASHLGARHRWVRFTPDVIGEGLQRFADVFNQPGPQPHYQIHTVHASRVAAEDGHRHLFTGDGCDSLFLGYPMVSQRARLVGSLSRLPGVLRRTMLRAASARPVERRLGHVARLVRSTLRAVELPPPAAGHLPTCYLDEVALERLRVDGPPGTAESVREVRLRLAADVADLDPVRLAFDGKRRTAQSRTKVEGSVSASGSAQMSPYQHPLVRSFARALPTAYLRPAGSAAGAPGKAVLLEMAREYELLPRAVIDMPKQSPVDSPVDRWYAGPLRPTVHRMLEGLPFEYDRDYVDEILAPKRAEELFRERVSLGHHAFQAIGLLCSYAAFTGRAP